jgi:hypothetical protein
LTPDFKSVHFLSLHAGPSGSREAIHEGHSKKPPKDFIMKPLVSGNSAAGAEA